MRKMSGFILSSLKIKKYKATLLRQKQSKSTHVLWQMCTCCLHRSHQSQFSPLQSLFSSKRKQCKPVQNEPHIRRQAGLPTAPGMGAHKAYAAAISKKGTDCVSSPVSALVGKPFWAGATPIPPYGDLGQWGQQSGAPEDTAWRQRKQLGGAPAQEQGAGGHLPHPAPIGMQSSCKENPYKDQGTKTLSRVVWPVQCESVPTLGALSHRNGSSHAP